MAKRYESTKNGVTRTSRNNRDGVRSDKFTSRPGSSKGKDHSGYRFSFSTSIAKIFGSGENLGKRKK